VNGDDGAGSPYRRALRIDGPQPGDTLTPWLTGILDAWRQATTDSLVEPWDYYYQAGEASRRLSARIPRDSLLPITARAYRALGADLSRLAVHYDLDSKNPVAYTTFGSRGYVSDAGDWVRPRAWVFANYSAGGFDNLDELMHETGHAVHISAIHTRPAFDDWPDSDPLTEAIGDLVALDVYEPRWQWRFLGDSVSRAAGMRAKYASIMLDIAWALFEARVRADPGADPNVVWTEITRRYLHIAPHPEWSWWAMRGQLVDSPGYMMNYAVGAIMAADLRAAIQRRDSTWYGWVSDRLFQFGLARPSDEVMRGVLGRPLSPQALLDDLSRMR
jgi:oligoendopeptidase F